MSDAVLKNWSQEVYGTIKKFSQANIAWWQQVPDCTNGSPTVKQILLSIRNELVDIFSPLL